MALESYTAKDAILVENEDGEIELIDVTVSLYDNLTDLAQIFKQEK